MVLIFFKINVNVLTGGTKFIVHYLHYYIHSSNYSREYTKYTRTVTLYIYASIVKRTQLYCGQ